VLRGQPEERLVEDVVHQHVGRAVRGLVSGFGVLGRVLHFRRGLG
jgi:hypothetical protein